MGFKLQQASIKRTKQKKSFGERIVSPEAVMVSIISNIGDGTYCQGRAHATCIPIQHNKTLETWDFFRQLFVVLQNDAWTLSI